MTNREFAREWCTAWNAHDVERVLALFHDDVVFASPMAAEMFPETGGRVEGKAALRAYWTEGLRRSPDLQFTIVHLYESIGTIVIEYRNQKGAVVCEVLVLEEGEVRWGSGCYMADQ